MPLWQYHTIVVSKNGKRATWGQRLPGDNILEVSWSLTESRQTISQHGKVLSNLINRLSRLANSALVPRNDCNQQSYGSLAFDREDEFWRMSSSRFMYRKVLVEYIEYGHPLHILGGIAFLFNTVLELLLLLTRVGNLSRMGCWAPGGEGKTRTECR